MSLVTRRLLMKGAGGLVLAATTSVGAYAVGIEPGLRLAVTSYQVTPPHWPADLEVKAAVIADLHACEPWMSAARVRTIAEVTNALAPDIIFLLGDFNGGHRFVTGAVTSEEWAEALSILKAPLGVFSILGNHDWWHGALPSIKGDDGDNVRHGLRQAGISLLENDVKQLAKDGRTFWVAGIGDQMAIRLGPHWHKGVDDLDGTLAKVTDDAPVILLAHEPFVFDRVPDRVSLTLCGHTHGCQVNLPVISDIYARHHYGTTHVYGHIVAEGRHMIISAGLGTSIAPVRFRRPPEIVQVTLGGPALPAHSAALAKSSARG